MPEGWGARRVSSRRADRERDAGEAYLSATFTQQSPWFAMIAAKGSPSGCEEYGLWFSFSFFFFFYTHVPVRVSRAVRCGAVRCGCSGCGASRVSGSSRQELPTLRCLIAAAPVFFVSFFFSSSVFFFFPAAAAVALMFVASLVCVTSQS